MQYPYKYNRGGKNDSIEWYLGVNAAKAPLICNPDKTKKTMCGRKLTGPERLPLK